VVVDATATIVQAHHVALEAEHALMHALPRLTGALVHADPQPCDGVDHHAGRNAEISAAGAGRELIS
jgi:divalent metal cation (Fe/Co/Zn/Cd) transporter